MVASQEKVTWLGSKEFLEKHEGVISKNTLFKEAALGNIPHIKVGNRLKFPDDAFEQMLERQKGGASNSETKNGEK